MCAFESAIVLGKLPVKVIVIAKNFTIDHPALCSLFDKFYPEKLNFYSVDFDELFRGTSLEGIKADRRQSKPVFTNMSDMMRAAILYKYGGFYFDQDVVTLNDLRGLRNILVMDNILT